MENSQQIKVAPTSGYTAGDVLKINCADYTITVNGTAVDYTGVIVDWVQGGNDFKLSFIGDNWNCTLKLIYYDLYL